WSLACHFSAYSMFFFPFGHLIGPLVVWLSRRDSDVTVNEHGKASINFQLTMTLVFATLMSIIGGFVIFLFATGAFYTVKDMNINAWTSTVIGSIVAILGIVLISVFATFYYWVIIAVNGIRAYDGKAASYFPSVRFIK
ncbi:MAG: DUF4870 domain-containing protein, partial [Bdellovibrionota bacterium]